MQPKFTPGPWTAERANVGDTHPLFVRCNLDSAFRPPCDADAHLIAAAPELYAALDRYVRMDQALAGAMGTVLDDSAQPYTQACAALAKANPEKWGGKEVTRKETPTDAR